MFIPRTGDIRGVTDDLQPRTTCELRARAGDNTPQLPCLEPMAWKTPPALLRATELYERVAAGRGRERNALLPAPPGVMNPTR